MIETEFKVLMFAGTHVDYNLLDKGIYTSSTPNKLYPRDQTLTDLVRYYGDYMSGIPTIFGGLSERFLENLRKCELVTVHLTIKNNNDD